MKSHPKDATLSYECKTQLEELLRQRKSTKPLDGSGEYQRITARIRYLRYGPESTYQWRRDNADRIKYERAAGIAYCSRSTPKELTPEQRQARVEAAKRSDAKNPQRQIRRNIERTILLAYNTMSKGESFTSPPRRAEALWGCDVAAFKRHIKDQLVKLGFTWSDWKDKWTMDHIVPVRKFTLPSDQFACWNFTNLRPLPKALNHKARRN